jgi:hypothetical protein
LPLPPIGERGFFRVKVSSFAEASEDKEECDAMNLESRPADEG